MPTEYVILDDTEELDQGSSNNGPYKKKIIHFQDLPVVQENDGKLRIKKHASDVSFDSIILGSGYSGMTIANLLQYHGHHCLIIEKDKRGGGYAVCFWRNQFRFDASLHICQLYEGVINVLAKFNGEGLLKPIFITNKHRITYYKGVKIKFDTIENFQNSLSPFINDQKKFNEFVLIVKQISEITRSFVSGGNLDRLMAIIKDLQGGILLYKIMRMNAYDFMKEYFSDDRIIDLIYGMVAFLTTEKQNLNAMIFCISFMDCFSNRSYYLEGGSGGFIERLLEQYKKQGGSIEFGESIESIQKTTEGYKITLKNKKTSLICRNLIFACDIFQSFNLLNASNLISSDLVAKLMNNRTIGYSAIVAYIGLDIDVADFGYSEYMYNDIREIPSEEEFRLSLSELKFDKNFFSHATIYSNCDKSCIKGTGTTLSLIQIADYYSFEAMVNYTKNYRDRKAYQQAKRKVESIFLLHLRHIFRKIKNIDEHIRHFEVATPFTFKNFTWNEGGSMIGFVLDNELLFNAIPQQLSKENIYFCSQWSGIGGGFSGGILNAEKVFTMIRSKISEMKPFFSIFPRSESASTIITRQGVKIKSTCIQCFGCLNICPQTAISFQHRKRNSLYLRGKLVIDPLKCNLCGMCTSICPVDAIIVDNINKNSRELTCGRLKNGKGVCAGVFTINHIVKKAISEPIVNIIACADCRDNGALLMLRRCAFLEAYLSSFGIISRINIEIKKANRD